MKKIVAIGGGKNGRIKSDGTQDPYETANIDKEIVKLAEKENPKFLFISHAQSTPELEKGYFETMSRIYKDKYGCICDYVSREDLKKYNKAELEEKVLSFDIIYVGGGDTKTMMELWREYSFCDTLKKAYDKGIVMSGLSAGANCWFSYCSSDSLKIINNDDTAPMIEVKCLGWINAFFTPHYDEKTEFVNREEHMKDALENRKDIVGIGISNCVAIEILDDTYRIITSSENGFAKKCYFAGNQYITENIEVTNEFKNIYNIINK